MVGVDIAIEPKIAIMSGLLHFNPVVLQEMTRSRATDPRNVYMHRVIGRSETADDIANAHPLFCVRGVV
jgi:hypothetical protein